LADEIDSIMMVDNSHGAKLSNDMLNEFKKGFTDKLGRHENITVFGCTNLPIDVESKTVMGTAKELDSAMLDRFQLKYEVGAPDKDQLLGLLKKTYSKYEGSPYIDERLIKGVKGEDSDIQRGFEEMCKMLASDPQNRQFNFRKLKSIISESPRRIAHEDRPLAFKDLVDMIESQKSNYKITDEAFAEFKKKVQHLL
jgi:hypothetical protein